MPKLTHAETGEPIFDDLTVEEIEKLSESGVEIEAESADVSGESGVPDPDDVPDKLVESDPSEIEFVPYAEAAEGEDGEPIEAHVEGEYAEHHIEGVEEMRDRDELEIEERYSVRFEEIHKVDERERAKWVRLVKQLREYGTDVETRKRERDDRIESNQSRLKSRSRSGEDLHKRARRKGIIEDLEEGFRKLVTRPSPRPAEVGPQIDPYNAVRRAAGDVTIQELFEEQVDVETGDRCIGVATDISGSMGNSIDELKIAAGCLGEAASIIGDEFVWEAFTDKPRWHGSEKALDLRIVTAPEEEFEWEQVDSFDSAKNEPTAAGIRDCRMLMEQTSAREYVMFVITDGMALITEDGKKYTDPSVPDNAPVEQAREAVNECRRDGIEVVGLGIGSMSDAKMEETFGGGSYRLTSIDKLADDILELYADMMDVDRGGW